jgi:acetolactate synthase-1/2/3 large subunit
MTFKTVGEHLVELLEARGVDTVFGIPGVHTIELYRGLGASKIRHITPRHEQGAGFMADGYARASGKPGVVFVITGPGLTNTITAMAQARLDSVPMLVISGVNRRDTLGKNLGFLHELPDQQSLAAEASLWSQTILTPEELEPALARAFADFATKRPGPIHIEVPTDVMKLPAAETKGSKKAHAAAPASEAAIGKAGALLSSSRRPVIIAGGGARKAATEVRALAELLDAPVVQTVNARGIVYKHPLSIPASPSLAGVRALLVQSDCVIAVGTEFGETDFDMYCDGNFPKLKNVIRIDIDAAQVMRRPHALSLIGDAKATVAALLSLIPIRETKDGSAICQRVRQAAKDEIGARARGHLDVVKIIRDTLPDSLIVGDSTQAVYAGNLYYDHDHPFGWFNSSTGFGALGYGAPAAIGAQLGAPGRTVVCLTGDGGLQFSLAELGSAADVDAPVIFVVWNNNGYQEIETSMIQAGIVPIGVTPSAPDFVAIANAYGISGAKPKSLGEFAQALKTARDRTTPFLICLDEAVAEGSLR